MCLAVPGRVTEIYTRHGASMGRVDFGGIQKEICLEFVPDIQVGEFAIVHAGFALRVIDETAARETLRTLAELDMPNEDLTAKSPSNSNPGRP